MELLLTARPPFSLPAVMYSHGWLQLAPYFAHPTQDGFAYVTRLSSGQALALEIQAAPGGVCVSCAGQATLAEQTEIARQIAWMLALEADLGHFYTITRAEPKLAQVEARAQGRLLRSATLFEDVVKTILTTNTAWSGTRRMAQALVEHFGTPAANAPDRRAFPAPTQLAAADEATLRATARLGYRAPYVLALARAVTERALDLEALKATDAATLPTPELRRQLLAIKGIGAYAAAHLLLFLGRYDFLPIDSWARKMVSQEWHAGRPIGPAEVEAAFARWGAWKGLAYWFWEWDSNA